MDLSKLNKEQREVAEELEQHVLLLAPAGTGKTDTLSCRVANIIEQNRALPEEILCLTFTNKACREMRERIEEKVGEAGNRVMVRTFHGFCFDLVKTEAKRHADFFADFAIVDEVDCQSILREVSEGHWPLRALQSLVGQLKESRAVFGLAEGAVMPARGEESTAGRRQEYEQVLQRLLKETPEKVKALAIDDRYEFYPQLYAGWQKWGPGLTAAYDERLLDMHGLDFTDLIVNAQRLLMDPEIAGRWARRFAYISIDEVQDTSELEYAVISRIFGMSRLLLCGDYFQTIYEWRGSRPEKVLRSYQRDYHPRRIVLHENYRATQKLLNASFACLQSFFPERVSALYPEGLTAESPEEGEFIELKGAMEFAEEAQWIYYRIQHLPVKDYSRVCILTRSNRYNKDLSSQFRSLGRNLPENERLPFMLIDEMRFFRRQEIKDVLAFLHLAMNRHDAASLIRLLSRFGRGIGPATIKAIGAEEVRRTGLKLTDFLELGARRTGDPFSNLIEAMSQGQVVVFDVESTGVDITRDEIIQIAGIRLAPDGSVAEEFYRNLRPDKGVGQSVRVHGLTDAYLQKHGESPQQVLEEFCHFARGCVLVGHNVTYDLGILGSELARLGMPQLDYPCYYDTLEIFRRFYPNLPNHKLEFLSEHFQTEHASSHDAMDDIRATADILNYALAHDVVPRTEERRAYFAQWQGIFEEMAELMASFRQQAPLLRPWKLITEVVLRGGVKEYYQRHKEEQRIQNLRELYLQARDLDDVSLCPLDALARFLQYTTLSNTELEALNQRSQIPIITVHQAKGSEFDYVFLAGLQEGTFPGFHAQEKGKLPEEQRLFYVGITRAKKQLFLSWTQRQYGHSRHISPFIHAIPRKYLKNM
ncbi:MAG: UvrD-helicase domain-containing protein [Selenomonas sp.]|nr:UvrD-helicase domain-containing protein [Selenomonas sp.]